MQHRSGKTSLFFCVFTLKNEGRCSMSIDWKAFYANGGDSNENSDPESYDNGREEVDYLDPLDEYNDWRNDNF